jgi:hypothetical protein
MPWPPTRAAAASAILARMTIPKFDDVRDERLTTDEDVLQRVAALLQRAVRWQLWLMFLDDESRQLPVIMPSYVPRSPSDGHRAHFSSFVGVLTEDVEADAIVIVYERRGTDELRDADRRWLRFIATACADAAVALRGPLLLHDGGVRWIAPEDYAEAQK